MKSTDISSKLSPRDKNWWQHTYTRNNGKAVAFVLILEDHGDPTLTALAQDADSKRVAGWPWDGYTVRAIYRDRLIPHVATLTAVGAEIYDMPVFIEVSSLDDLVPLALFGSTTLDDNDNELNITWGTWAGHVLDIDGRIFIASNAFDGRTPLISELDAVKDQLVFPQDLPQPEPIPE